MEIPMAQVIESYRGQLSEALHQVTLQSLHIKTLEELVTETKQKNDKLQKTVDMYAIAENGEDLNDEPDDWGLE